MPFGIKICIQACPDGTKQVLPGQALTAEYQQTTENGVLGTYSPEELEQRFNRLTRKNSLVEPESKVP